MGYAAYEDPTTRRWAGYAVPAECDWPNCTTTINRGQGHQCADHGQFALLLDGERISYDCVESEPDAVEEWVSTNGCGLFFCSDHRHRTTEHAGIAPKPDAIIWVRHQLTSPSWAEWREDRPDLVDELGARAGAGQPCGCSWCRRELAMAGIPADGWQEAAALAEATGS